LGPPPAEFLEAKREPRETEGDGEREEDREGEKGPPAALPGGRQRGRWLREGRK
jgi:hypothetical protein